MVKRRILVVDDERIVAEDISECLTQMGCEILGVAVAGQEAIDKAERLLPDLILMDVCLQGAMDGIEAATIIRQRLEIPAVFLTAYSDPAVLARAKVAEPAGYIVKPFEEASLRSTVEIALHKCDMEKALRQSHEWFSTVLMSIGDGVIVSDPAGVIQFMNPEAETITGWRSSQAAGHKVDDIFPIYDTRTGQRAANPALRALTEGVVCGLKGEGVLLRHDGTSVPIDDSGAPIRNNKGEITGAVLVFRDVTDSRQAQYQLRQYQQHLEGLVHERTAEIMKTNERLVCEIDERKRIEDALAFRAELESVVSSISAEFLDFAAGESSRGFEKAVRATAQFLRVESAFILAVNDSRNALSCAHEWGNGRLHPLAATFKERPFTLPALHAGREPLQYPLPQGALPPPALVGELLTALQAPSVLIVPVLENDQLTGWFGVATTHSRFWGLEETTLLKMVADLLASAFQRARTEADKQRLQAQLTRSQRMEAVGRLSGGIAHDFNNTLLPIIGYADMLLGRLPQGDPSIIELGEIRRAAKHAASLTRQLLTFSKKQVVNKMPIDLNSSISDIRKMLQRIIGEDIALSVELDPQLRPVMADAGQIEQVLMNLVVNARDAMPQGGSVRVRTQNVTAGQVSFALVSGKPASGSYVRLSITDTGCGIPPEIRERIFDPFFSTKGNDGTGLGLSVIFSIIESHLGGVEVESYVGRGTTFHIYLPVSSQPLPQTAVVGTTAAPAAVARGTGQRILLVEDEEAVNKFVSQALRMSGYNVLAASCVREALQKFDQENGCFDMVFTDAILPDGNGVELLANVLGRRPDLRALLSSGYTDKHALIELATQRDISFLQKPYSLPDLLRTVSEVINGSAPKAVLN